jgi:hypothetical protein
MSGLRRLLLWELPRGGWQYDVMVAIILAFIFLTPRDWFRDQPRASSVVMLPEEHGARVYWIEADLLTGSAESARSAQAAELIRKFYGRRENIVRLEPIYDAEKDVKGFMAYTRS